MFATDRGEYALLEVRDIALAPPSAGINGAAALPVDNG